MEFSRLFRGRSDAYGTYKIEKKEGEKVKGSAKTVSSKLTPKLYQNHLDGKESLGVIPLTEDGTCWFGAIDIDIYNLDFKSFEENIKKHSLPLIMCRTKSGGLHLYLFLKSQVQAFTVRQRLKDFSQALNLSSVEIFPKQESGMGNWINLPYFNALNTDRYAWKDGKVLSYEEFLLAAENSMVTEKELEEIYVPILEDMSDAPPCLQTMCLNGIQKGEKDLTLFNLAVYAKLRYPDTWKDKLELMNQEYCKPPAQRSTLENVIRPHSKKTYFYTCEKFPIATYCNKELCKKVPYGIGNEQPSVALGELKKVDSIPPVWIWEVDGEKIEFQTDELLQQIRFRKVILEKLNTIPKLLKEHTWTKLINEKLEKVEIIPAPEDASQDGQFMHHLRAFCTERPGAKNKGELLQHKTYAENGKTFFQSSDLMTFLNQRKFTNMKPNMVYNAIRRVGGEPKSISVKGVTLRVWSIPSFQGQTEEFDIPTMEKDPF